MTESCNGGKTTDVDLQSVIEINSIFLKNVEFGTVLKFDNCHICYLNMLQNHIMVCEKLTSWKNKKVFKYTARKSYNCIAKQLILLLRKKLVKIRTQSSLFIDLLMSDFAK
jgi:hypothetical protein